MTNTELIQKIKAEIERRIYEISPSLKDGYEVRSTGKIEGLSELWDFLDTLESERPMNPNDAMKELAESEDERIRSLLVWQVHRNIEDDTNDLAQSVYDGIKGHDPDLEESIEDWKKCLAYLEKQKEQKPAPISCGHENGTEWSEEDEEMLEYIIGDVNDAKQLYTTRGAKYMADKEISWLKSLRPSWKPSEEQMKALQCSIAFMEIRKSSDYDISPLKSLYEQLKKL